MIGYEIENDRNPHQKLHLKVLIFLCSDMQCIENYVYIRHTVHQDHGLRAAIFEMFNL